MELDEGEESADLGFRRDQLVKLRGERLGIVKEVARHDLRSGGQVPLVQEQVDHREDLRQACAELVRIRDAVGDACVDDLALGSGNTLSYGGLRYEECTGDLCGGEPTHHSERERDLCCS